MFRSLKTRILMAALSITVASMLVVPATPAAALTPNQSTPGGVVNTLNADINYFWWWTFRSAGWTYQAPAAYVYYNGTGLPTTVTMGGCGQTATNNSYYCSSDLKIYLDLTWHTALIRGTGDFASAFVLIHEWSHHIQTVRPGNHMGWSTQYSLFAGRELQADCYAGIYTRYLAMSGRLASDDINEAWAWLGAHGDSYGLSPYDPQAHGTPAQRRAWFAHGYNSYSLSACDGVYQAIYWPNARSN
jgi:predicted metalloprotease